MNIGKNDTAVVVTDPQNDILSDKGVAWGMVGDNAVMSTEEVVRATG